MFHYGEGSTSWPRLGALGAFAILAVAGCSDRDVTIDSLEQAPRGDEVRLFDAVRLEHPVAHPDHSDTTVRPDQEPLRFEAGVLGGCYTEFPADREVEWAMLPDVFSPDEQWYRLEAPEVPEIERLDELTVRLMLTEANGLTGADLDRERLDVEIVPVGRAVASLQLGADVFLFAHPNHPWTSFAVAVRDDEALFLSDCGYRLTEQLEQLAETEATTAADLFLRHVEGRTDIPSLYGHEQQDPEERKREDWESLPAEVRPLEPGEAPPEVAEKLKPIFIGYDVAPGEFDGWVLCFTSELGSSGCSDLTAGPGVWVHHVDPSLPLTVSLVREEADGTLSERRDFIGQIEPRVLTEIDEGTAIDLGNIDGGSSGRGELTITTIPTDEAIERRPSGSS